MVMKNLAVSDALSRWRVLLHGTTWHVEVSGTQALVLRSSFSSLCLLQVTAMTVVEPFFRFGLSGIRVFCGSGSSLKSSFVLSLVLLFHLRELPLVIRDVSCVVLPALLGHGVLIFSTMTARLKVKPSQCRLRRLTCSDMFSLFPLMQVSVFLRQAASLATHLVRSRWCDSLSSLLSQV